VCRTSAGLRPPTTCKSDAEVREAISEKFPKHIYHSIVCIGALIAHWEPDHWAVAAIGAPHVGERTLSAGRAISFHRSLCSALTACIVSDKCQRKYLTSPFLSGT